MTSHVVEHKGAVEWATKVAARDILLSSLKDFVFESDGERSIVALKHEVVRKLRRAIWRLSMTGTVVCTRPGGGWRRRG